MDNEQQQPRKEDLTNPLRIFKNRDYTLYFGGQLISQVGTWMQQIALSWLTYKLTSSAVLLAVVGASGQIPSLVIMPFAGVIADRFNRHRIVLITQAAAMLQAGILAYLTLTNQIQIWYLIALGLAMGVINAFDMPVRSAFVYDMVKTKEDLPAAVAMNASLMNTSRLIGPALAGFVVAAFGEGICFLLNSLSYIAVIGSLSFVRGNFDPTNNKKANVFTELKEGFSYAMSTSPIRAIILYLAAFGFGGMAYAMLLPVFVTEIGGNADTLGYLSAASALGSTLGTFILATRKKVVGMGNWIVGSSFVYALAIFGFGLTHSLWPAMFALCLLGAAMMLQMGCCNTILQSLVDQDKRGRVMSLFTMAFMGTVPLGSLLAGSISNQFGFHNMLFACGSYCLIVAATFAYLLPRLRNEGRGLYVQRGLLEAEEELETITKPNA